MTSLRTAQRLAAAKRLSKTIVRKGSEDLVRKNPSKVAIVPRP